MPRPEPTRVLQRASGPRGRTVLSSPSSTYLEEGRRTRQTLLAVRGSIEETDADTNRLAKGDS